MSLSTSMSYADAQAKCKFKVGDKVRVVRKADGYEAGWSTRWVDDMDGTVGKDFVIGDIDARFGYRLWMDENQSAYWWFPFFVLKAPTAKRNRLSVAFRNAALYHLDTNQVSGGRNYYSCHALQSAARESKQSVDNCKKLYVEYMKPVGKGDNDCWFSYDEEDSDTQIHRGMCLLLMAEIVKDL